MDVINERFKELREACKKSQEEFGKILGITKSGVSGIENGTRNVTEKHLIMLSNWKEYNVNLNWLRDGTGEMFIPLSKDERIAKFTGEVLKDRSDSFKMRFMTMLAGLNESDWEFLEQKAKELFALKKD